MSGDEVRPFSGNAGPPGRDTELQMRVAALEADVKDVKAVLYRLEPLVVRIDERTHTLVGKGELGSLRSDVMVALASKATKGTIWIVGLSLVMLTVAALAAGAMYMLYVAEFLRRTG